MAEDVTWITTFDIKTGTLKFKMHYYFLLLATTALVSDNSGFQVLEYCILSFYNDHWQDPGSEILSLLICHLFHVLSCALAFPWTEFFMISSWFQKIGKIQESPHAWTQEAYRQPCSKSMAVGGTYLGVPFPHPDLAAGGGGVPTLGYPSSWPGWSTYLGLPPSPIPTSPGAGGG